jgi:threonine/homoserine/homoserine lactone efflux protein
MTNIVLVLCGVGLLICSFWSRPAGARRLLAALGVSILIWMALNIWIGKLHAANLPVDEMRSAIHLRGMMSGVLIGLMVALLLQVNLFVRAAQLEMESRKDGRKS